ncbi:MAG: fatty acid desaturase [Acidimicrobiales bacterium]
MLLRLLLSLAAGFALSQVASYVTTIYLHRTLAHRSVRLSPSLTFAARVVVWTTTGLRPREWAAVHRRHHAFTDTDGDPHSPRLLGWLRVQLSNAALYRRAARDGETVSRYARDIPRDGWDRVLFDRSWLGLGIGITLLIVVLGPVWGIVAALWHTVCYLSLNAAVNSLGHTFGRQPNDNSATNLQWLAWLTGGEGLHNNHHAAPTTAKLAFRSREIDPAWPVIRSLRRLGWATVRHEHPPDRSDRAPAQAA